MKKLAIIITHPIQYYSPIFKLLAERKKISLTVFYTWEQSKEKVWDEKFGKDIKWDIPLLDGYDFVFTKNTSKHPGSGTYSGVINPTLINEIKDLGPDAILVFGWNHQSHFKAMRYFKGKIPVWFRGDSMLLDETRWIRTFLRRLCLIFVYRFVDLAFYVGSYNKFYFLKHGLTDKQLVFAPHAIDNERFFDFSGKHTEMASLWRKYLGFVENDSVVLFVGKFEPKKNPLLLVKASKQLPEFKFLFVGNGLLENEMKREAGENVVFLPFQNQSIMPVVYRLGNIFVLPSKGPGETWGLAVNEAMACGLPILVSNKVGCSVDLVKPHYNGQIFNFNSIDDFINKLILVSKNCPEYGLNSRKMITDWCFLNIVKSIEQGFIE